MRIFERVESSVVQRFGCNDVLIDFSCCSPTRQGGCAFEGSNFNLQAPIVTIYTHDLPSKHVMT